MQSEALYFRIFGKCSLSIFGRFWCIYLACSYSSAQSPSDDTLLFLGNQNIAPVVYLEDGEPTGVAIDIVNALAKHIAQPLKIKAMDWKEAQKLVAQGEADALIQINQTEERKKVYDFTDPLLESQFSIFVHTSRVGISGISSLRGLRVGVEAGGLPLQILEKNSKIQLDTIPNFLDGFHRLSEGTLDAIVVDYRVGSYILGMSNIRNIKATGEPITFSYSAFAVKKGNSVLLNSINRALQRIKADGTYQGILDKWQPKEAVFYTREQIQQMMYYLVTLILLIGSLIALIWIFTLRKELVKIKATEAKLREQYSTLHSIINSTTALIFSVNREYRYTCFNQGHAAVMNALYGVQIELGHTLLDAMNVPEDREIAKHNLDLALHGEQIEEESYSGDELRSRQYFHVSHSPIKTEQGEIIGVAVLSQDITARRRSEEALKESEQSVQRKLDAILSPDTDLGVLELADAIDVGMLQHLMDEFYRLTSIGIGIIDRKGKVLVGTGRQDICAKFHRVNPESCRICLESDQELSRNVLVGASKLYQCKNNLREGAAPIMLGTMHVGNIILGPFLFDDETFRQQARLYGFHDQEYLAALNQVPRWSREIVNHAMAFYSHFAELIGKQSYSSIKLAKALEEHKRMDEAKQRLYRELRAISDCNQTLMRAENEQALLHDICQIICNEAGYRMAWVGFSDNDEAMSIRPAAWAGTEEGYLEQAQFTWANTERGQGPSGRAIRSGESVCVQDFANDPVATPWRGAALLRGYRASIALPLKDEGKRVFGVLNIYSTTPNAFSEGEEHLLTELAGDLAFGITVLRSRIERQQAEDALIKLNEKLEARVKDRTAELEKKNHTLEQMNRLFVGRELRMKELKAKIAKLEGKNHQGSTEP